MGSVIGFTASQLNAQRTDGRISGYPKALSARRQLRRRPGNGGSLPVRQTGLLTQVRRVWLWSGRASGSGSVTEACGGCSVGREFRDLRPMSARRLSQIRVEGAVLAGVIAFGAALMFGIAIGGFDDSPIRSSGVALTPDAHWLAIGVLVGAVVGAIIGAVSVAPGLAVGRLRPVRASIQMAAIVYVAIALLWPLAGIIVDPWPTGVDSPASVLAEITAYWPFALILDVFYAIPGLPICFAFSLAWVALFRAVVSPSAPTSGSGTVKGPLP
jgi:hypothetical protein